MVISILTSTMKGGPKVEVLFIPIAAVVALCEAVESCSLKPVCEFFASAVDCLCA